MALIAVAVIAIGGYAYPVMQQVAPTAGGVTTGTAFPHGISVGLPTTTPTNFSKFKGGTCNLIMSSFTLAASTSIAADCAIPGLVSGDKIFGWFSTTTETNGSAGWLVAQQSPSTTPGFATFRILNLNGVSAVIPKSIASSTNYFMFGTQ